MARNTYFASFQMTQNCSSLKIDLLSIRQISAQWGPHQIGIEIRNFKPSANTPKNRKNESRYRLNPQCAKIRTEFMQSSRTHKIGNERAGGKLGDLLAGS